MARRKWPGGDEVQVIAEGATIRVRRRAGNAGLAQLNARIPEELAKSLRLFAVQRGLLVRDIVEGCIRAVLRAA
jgi:hypothetical protein